MEAQVTCADRVQASWERIREDLQTLRDAEDNETEDLGHLYEYGLSFGYVEADTFEDQPLGYYRYQKSWGGPAEELRFEYDHIKSFDSNVDCYKVEFWFLDWFDGACIELAGDDLELAMWLFDMHIVE
jgi:hypothetical protein